MALMREYDGDDVAKAQREERAYAVERRACLPQGLKHIRCGDRVRCGFDRVVQPIHEHRTRGGANQHPLAPQIHELNRSRHRAPQSL